jgi:hypothetical protein
LARQTLWPLPSRPPPDAAAGRCPAAHSVREKTVMTMTEPVAVARGYFHCRACGSGFFPADRSRLGQPRQGCAGPSTGPTPSSRREHRTSQMIPATATPTTASGIAPTPRPRTPQPPTNIPDSHPPVTLSAAPRVGFTWHAPHHQKTDRRRRGRPTQARNRRVPGQGQNH